MNYEQFREWRDQAVLQKDNLPKGGVLRLDCMNPAKALDHMVADNRILGATPMWTAQVWSETMGIPLQEGGFVVGSGVRVILQALLEVLGYDRRYWLPEDVYPVYWELAEGRTIEGFETLVDFNLDFLSSSGEDDCLLLPCPLSPLGRFLTPEELETLAFWLDESERRRLLRSTWRLESTSTR